MGIEGVGGMGWGLRGLEILLCFTTRKCSRAVVQDREPNIAECIKGRKQFVMHVTAGTRITSGMQ